MEPDNNSLFQVDAFEQYEGFKPEWDFFSGGRKLYKVSYLIDSAEKTAVIQCMNEDSSKYYLCAFDKEQTLFPGMKRLVISGPERAVAGTITYQGPERSIINEHIFVQIEGLRINYYDSCAEEKKLLAYCYMYDDKDTLELCCSRSAANRFSVCFLKSLEQMDTLVAAVFPVIGFI